MKKWLSALLALVMLVTMLSGCGQKAEQSQLEPTNLTKEGIFYELTGVSPETTVMTVSGNPISAEEYLYWVSYLCASVEYNILSYNAYYGSYADLINEDGTLKWDNEFQNGMTLAEYIIDETESTIKFYTAIELMAQKYNAGLDSTDLASVATDLNSAIEELGSQEAFEAYLAKLGICQDTFQDLASSKYLFDNLLLLVLEEGTDLYLAPENYNKYASYADHILLMTIDINSGKPLSPSELEIKKGAIESMLTQLQESADMPTLFAQLADEYSEDTGRAENPNGYVFTPGTMVESFEKAVAALEPGQISGVVESDYGYHIILRKDLLEALESDPEQRVSLAETHLTTVLTILAGEATVEKTKHFQDLNVGEFYAAYEAKVTEMSAPEGATK